MPQHVIVDGSNLATEGRTMPSLQQLNEAIASYRGDHPDVLMTVVVDATFGHRIDPREVPEFEKAIDSNEFVAPPAGAVGRGDGFILNIAQKANASILSNDSYQEFHGEFAWLFDEGRLIGGKPVPHVGWVWVNRVPVRGPISRRSVKEGKIVEKSPGRRRGAKAANDTVVIGSASANEPMPIPKMPPPGAVMPIGKAARDQAEDDAASRGRVAGDRNARERSGRDERAGDQRRADQHANSQNKSGQNKSGQNKSGQNKSDGGEQAANDQRKDVQSKVAAKTTNDLLSFLSFVEHYPVGTAVTGVVESYSSHGAYVAIGDAHGYVPLRLMADPAPRSAREAMGLGETVTLVVSSFGAARRSIDLAVPSMAPIVVPPVPKARRGAKKAAPTAQEQVIAEAIAATESALPTEPAGESAGTAKRGKAAQASKSVRASKSEKADKSAKSDTSEKSEKGVKSAKPDKPEKAAKNAKPSKSASAANPAPVPEGDADAQVGSTFGNEPGPTSAKRARGMKNAATTSVVASVAHVEPAARVPPVGKPRGRSAKPIPETLETAVTPAADRLTTVVKGGPGRTKKVAATTGGLPNVVPSPPAATKKSAARRRPIKPSGTPP